MSGKARSLARLHGRRNPCRKCSRTGGLPVKVLLLMDSLEDGGGESQVALFGQLAPG